MKKNSIKQICTSFVIGMFLISGNVLKGQEGALLSKYKPGYYYDKDGNKVEGFLKYVITTINPNLTTNIEGEKTEMRGLTREKLPKKIKFKKSEDSEKIVLEANQISSFSIPEYGNIYHTLYKDLSQKALNKGKGAYFAKVFIGGESPTMEKATIYLVPGKPRKGVVVKGEWFPSPFLIRNGKSVKETKTSLIFPKYKRSFKKMFADCGAFVEAMNDKTFLKISNMREVIGKINKECK